MSGHGDMAEELTDYDWDEAFSYAEHPDVVPPGEAACGGAGFTRSDVERIEAYHATSPESYASTEIIAVGVLKDGRWFSIRAWCDTTGWGCLAGGDADVAATRDKIIRFGLDDSERGKLELA